MKAKKQQNRCQSQRQNNNRNCNNNINYDCIISSPVGKLGIVIVDAGVAKIDFLPSTALLVSPRCSTARRIVAEIKKYFSQPQIKFKLRLHLKGTLLQIKIWKALQRIVSGTTVTYGKLAQKIGTSPRVVGNACRANPVPVLIPCHRVVAACGLGGYCGANEQDKHGATKIKKWLLRHEGCLLI